MSVTRYDHHHECGIVDSESGKYILYSDYEKLQATKGVCVKCSENRRTYILASEYEKLLEENKKLLTQRDELLAAAKDLCSKSLGYLNSEDEILVRLETAIKSAMEEKK